MKKVVLLIFIFTVELCSYAQQQVDLEAAMKVGANIIGQKSKSAVAVDTLFYYLGKNNDTLMYQINYADGTYVLISGSYACFPILSMGVLYDNNPAWVDDGNRYEGQIELIESYLMQIDYCFNNDTIKLFHKSMWDSFLSGGSSANSKVRNAVEPLLSTRWGQAESNDNSDANAYNYYCPSSLGGSAICYAGCGATAMAQIMNYWKYPRYDVGCNYQFDWCNMVDGLYANSPNYINERDAIAKLMRNCGEIIRTQYCSNENNGSTSYIDTILLGFYYYGYSGMKIYCNNLQSVLEIIKQDISAGRPVFYSGGMVDGGGHFFICDGYNELGLFHINWGWNGVFDNYYYLNSLCPGNYSYTINNQAIVGIEPNTEDAGEMREWCTLNIELMDHYVTYYDLFNLSQYEPWENVINTTNDLVSIPNDERYPSSWRTIPSGESSEYIAHKSVTLLPGFHAERGSTFSARIVPCSNCDSEEMSSMTEQTVISGSGNIQDSFMQVKSVIGKEDTEEIPVNHLFPNPSHETITYRGKEVASMGIYDMTGKAVFRWFVVSKSENEIVVNIKDLRPSMYVLLLNMSDGTREVVRFIKE